MQTDPRYSQVSKRKPFSYSDRFGPSSAHNRMWFTYVNNVTMYCLLFLASFLLLSTVISSNGSRWWWYCLQNKNPSFISDWSPIFDYQVFVGFFLFLVRSFHSCCVYWNVHAFTVEFSSFSFFTFCPLDFTLLMRISFRFFLHSIKIMFMIILIQFNTRSVLLKMMMRRTQERSCKKNSAEARLVYIRNLTCGIRCACSSWRW
jgi:hypothetical protein